MITKRERIGLAIWKVTNKLARVGCWLRGSHIAVKGSSYCRQCGLFDGSWRLTANRGYHHSAG